MNKELCVIAGGRAVIGHEHSLARCESIRFDDVGGTEFVERRFDFRHSRRRHRSTGRNAGGVHDFFCKLLRAFDLGGGFVWAENRDADGAKRIRNAGDEGRFRADDNEFDTLLHRIIGDEGTIRRIERDRLDHSGNSRVSGGNHDLVGGRVAQQSVDDGVLSGTGPNHEYLHVKTLPLPLLACWACLFPESIPNVAEPLYRRFVAERPIVM